MAGPLGDTVRIVPPVKRRSAAFSGGAFRESGEPQPAAVAAQSDRNRGSVAAVREVIVPEL